MWVIKKIRTLFSKSKNSAHPVVFSLAPNIPESKADYLVYKSYLDAALNDNNIWNIAITGNYGIGKSSFLQWYTGKKNIFLLLSVILPVAMRKRILMSSAVISADNCSSVVPKHRTAGRSIMM